MTFLIVVVWGAIGFICGGVIATELAPLFGIRHMEGASAMFGLVTGSPIGLIGGGWFGWAMARRFADDKSKREKFLLATFGGIAAVVAGGVIFESINSRDQIQSSGGSLWLTCYIRLPEGATAPNKDTSVVLELRSDKETRRSSPYGTPEWSIKDGRPTMQSSVEVYRATPNRKAAVRIGDGPVHVFKVNAPARPKVYSYEGDWQKPEAVEGGEVTPGTAMETKCLM